MVEEFKIKFRGVRGSYTIADKNYMKYGGNTSCVEVRAGGHLIILDAGSGLINVGDELVQKHITSSMEKQKRKPIRATVLLSHIHQDHIQGFTFFKPLHIPSTVINVFGNSANNLATELDGLLFNKTFPLSMGDIAGKLDIKTLNKQEGLIFEDEKSPVIRRFENDEESTPKGNQVVVTCYRSSAHPQEGVLIYKIAYKDKTIVYATDVEGYYGGDKRLESFAKGCNILIHDTQYTTEDYLDSFSSKQGYGHSTFEMAHEMQNHTGAKKLLCFHYDPSYDDYKLDSIAKQYKPYGDKIQLAYEGLEIDLMQ